MMLLLFRKEIRTNKIVSFFTRIAPGGCFETAPKQKLSAETLSQGAEPI
jgi:hypothetical protein